jgi:hypothetical protein
MEYGITIAKGISHVIKLLPTYIEDAENELSHIARAFLDDLYQQLIKKDENIAKYVVNSCKIFLIQMKTIKKLKRFRALVY